jgi:hypothetical protein
MTKEQKDEAPKCSQCGTPMILAPRCRYEHNQWNSLSVHILLSRLRRMTPSERVRMLRYRR